MEPPSLAYKNVIDARRASWRIVSSIEQKEEGRGNADHVSVIREYRAKIEAELSEICAGIVKLIDEKLVPAAGNRDYKVFYLKNSPNFLSFIRHSIFVSRGFHNIFSYLATNFRLCLFLQLSSKP